MEFAELGSAPISADQPAGISLPGLPDYEALDNELAKQGSVTDAGSLDWDRILQLSASLLGQGKDLKVAGALCAALAQTRRQAGLALGLHVYRELLESHWEAMTPPVARMRGRRNTVQWLLDRIGQVAPAWPVVAWPRAEREAFLGDLRGIDGFLAEHLEEAPMLRPLINQAATWVEELAVPVAEPEPAPVASPVAAAPVERAPLAPPSAPALPAPPALEGVEAGQLLGRTLEHLAQVGGRLQDQDPGDPAPYVLDRIAAWLALRNVPDADQGRTRIPAPSSQATDGLNAARAAQNARLTLTRAEGLLGDHIFWLDLNRLVVESLDALGWGKAARAVEQELRRLLAKLPGLEALAFADGTPFADEATRTWLQKLAKDAAPVGGGEADPVLEEAAQLAAAGELIPAATLLARAGGPGRTSFRRKTALCELLTQNRKGRAAAAVARDLLADLERFQVPAWEPALAVESLQAILAGLRVEALPADEPLLQAAFAHLALLDPGLALGQP